jgi:hypothetical protein
MWLILLMLGICALFLLFLWFVESPVNRARSHRRRWDD